MKEVSDGPSPGLVGF